MGRLSELGLKAHRFLFVLPPAATLERVRARLRPRAGGTDQFTPPPPLPHPIDAELGIDTSGLIGFEALKTGHAADRYNTSYGGSQPSIIRRTLSLIPDIETCSFYDLGCGKGRAMVVASEFSFREVVGVELVPAIADVAKRNAEIVKAKFPERPPIKVIQGDASTTPLPKGNVVVFFYHPFFKALMKKVADHIGQAMVSGHCGKVYIVYVNPIYFGLYDKRSRFRRFFADDLDFESSELGSGAAFEDQHDSVVIWQSTGPNMAPPLPGADRPVHIVPPGWRATTRPVPARSPMSRLGNLLGARS